MIFQDISNGRFYNEDCFDAMREIPDGVIDMVLCDLPYGTTHCSWDSVLPLDKLWAEYWRVCKGIICLTGNQPFSSLLIVSSIETFKHSWIWNKKNISNPMQAKRQPLKQHEDILIFSKNKSYNYFPIKTDLDKTRKWIQYKSSDVIGGEARTGIIEGNEGVTEGKYPKSIIDFSSANQKEKIHPTQKPVALFEYLIKTYTNENELVLDNTAGSGTTAIAAINTNRRWVCIEKEKEYYDKAIKRIVDHTWK